jgi:ribose transport system substrate-binding protein
MNPKVRLWPRRAWAASAVAALAIGVAACGSSSSSSGGSVGSNAAATSSGSSGGGGSASTAAASAIVNAHIKDPASIGPTVPVGKPIPTGKRVVYINCGPEGCTRVGAGLTAAGKALGWSVTTLTVGAEGTPQAIQAQLDQAIRLHPDAVVAASIPVVAFQREAAQLQAMHIPLILVFGTEPVGGPVSADLFDLAYLEKIARTEAAKTAVDIGCKGTVAGTILTGFGTVEHYVPAYLNEVKRLCPAVNTLTMNVNPATLGNTDGTNMANFLRANAGVKALLLGYDGMGGDLLTAAKSAGITLPNVYSLNTVAQGLQEAKAGQIKAQVPLDYTVAGWQAADALARTFTGQSAAPDDSIENTVIWSNDYHNIPNVAAGQLPPAVANYQAQFMKLWGK